MISYICILGSLFIPLICAAYAKFSVKGYNNSSPREFLEALQGQSKRAHHAQNNFYETFPAFAAGVLAVHQLNGDLNIINKLALTYVAARILYAYFYVVNMHVLRTISWMAAFAAIIGLYLTGILNIS